MSAFEFVFSLLAILLGLALAEVLGGLARTFRARGRVRIGWLTALLGAFVMAEIILFWRVIWRARAVLPDTSVSLFIGFGIVALYYFAAALVFPERLDEERDLDFHYLAEKRRTLGAILAANIIAYSARAALMGRASWAYYNAYDWTVQSLLYGALVTGLFVKGKRANIAVLAILLAIDLSDPISVLIAPN